MATLEYSFRIINERAIDRAFAGIERRIQRHNAFVARAFGERGTGMRGVPTAARGRSPAANASATARHYDQIGRAARAQYLKEGRDRIAMERRVAAERERIMRREESDRVRSVQRVAAAEQRAQKASVNTRRRFAAATAGRIGTAGRDAVTSVGGLAMGALAVGGGFAIAGALSAQSREQAAASRLANQAGNPALKGQLLKEGRGVKGFTGEEGLAGLESFVTKTGDLEVGRKILGDMGQLALATGTNLGDLGATAGQAFNVIRDQIRDPKKQVEELNSLMSVLAQQGALGAVEIRDLAQDFGKLGAATRAFEGGAPDLLRTMGGFAQLAVARGGAESSADASTAASRLASDIVTKRKKFEAFGVKIQSSKDKTKLRAPEEILADVLEKTGGDITKTSGLFGMESVKIFRGLSPVFTEAEKRKKGSGRAAVMSELKRFTGATLDPQALKERAASRMADPDMQFKEALKDFNHAIGDSLLPTLTRLVPQFAKLLPYVEHATKLFARLVDDFAKNPLAGLGKLILMKVAADLAMANIGRTLNTGIERIINGAMGAFGRGGGQGGTGGGGGKSNIGGAAGLGLQLGLTAATVILTAGIVNFERAEAEMAAGGKDLNFIRKATPAQLEEAREAVQRQKARADSAAKPGGAEQALSEASRLVSWMFGHGQKERDQFGQRSAEAMGLSVRSTESKTQEGFLAEMQVKLAQLEKAAAQNLEASKSVKEGGTAIKEGAAMMSKNGPNRGNTPSTATGT